MEDISIDLIDKQDIPSLMTKLAEYGDCGVAYRDIITCRTYAHSPDYDFLETVKTNPVRELERMYQCFWLTENNIKYGCLIIETRDFESALINVALIAIRILIRRELQEQRRRKQYASRLMLDIIEGKITDEMALMERLRSIGIRKDYSCLLLAIRLPIHSNKYKNENILCIDDFEKRLPSFAHAFLIRKNNFILCPLLLYDTRPYDILKLNEDVDTAAKTVIKEVSLSGQSPRCYIGISSPRSTLAALSECMYEASRSVTYARIHELSDTPIYWEKIGSFRMLFAISEDKNAKAMYLRVLGNLIKHDASHKNGSLNTLQKLVDSNWNIRETAKKMAFHPNTVKYRYNKIRELLGGNISDSSFRFDLDFALRLHLIYTYNSMEDDDIN